MRATHWIFLFVIAIAVTVRIYEQVTKPPETVWKAAMDRGNEAMSAGDYVKGEARFRDASATARQHGLDATMLAGSLDGLGWALRYQRRFAEAEPEHRTALELRRTAYPENHPRVIQSKVGLGIALAGMRKYEPAENLLTESLAAAVGGADTCQLAHALGSLAAMYRATRAFEKAEYVHRVTLELLEAEPSTTCEQFVVVLNGLGALYADSNQWERTEQVNRDAVGLARRMKGERAQLHGDALDALGATLLRRRRFEEAASTFDKAATVYSTMFPPSASKTGSSLQQQELALTLAGWPEEAAKVRAKGFALIAHGETTRDRGPREVAVGGLLETHVELASPVELLYGKKRGAMMAVRSQALEALRAGKADEAERLIAQVVASSRELSGFDQMIALQTAAHIRKSSGRLSEAEADLKEVLSLSVDNTGARSRSTANAHFELGAFYEKAGRPGDAIRAFREALNLYGDEDVREKKRALNLMGSACAADGRHAEARAAYQQSAALAEASGDVYGLSVALGYLADTQRKTRRLGEAEAAYQRALKLDEQLAMPQKLNWAAHAVGLAAVYEQTGRLAEAEDMYRRSVVFLEEHLGKDKPALRIPLDPYIDFLKARGRSDEASRLEARRNGLPEIRSY